MNKGSFINTIKNIIGALGFRLFLWANNLTQEEYFRQIYEQERSRKFGKEFWNW